MQEPAKKLGFGFMRLPLTDKSDQKSIDLPQVERMVDTFLARGFTYCDTAWMYHDFMSEEVVGRALVARHPRDSFTIATKMPAMMLKSEQDVADIYAAQKKKLGVDFFDYYLAHNLNSINYKKAQRYHALEFLREKRAAGEIRCLGFSFHDSPEMLEKILTENPFFEFVQLQINYLDWESAGIRARECYETAVRHGLKVIVMEPIKGGTLADPPAEVRELLREAHADWSPAEWAIRFAASLPAVMVVLSGMSDFAQLDENTRFMADFAPLSADDQRLLLRAAEKIRASIAIPCTGCRYCVEANHCPKSILIPNDFALYNTAQLLKRRHAPFASEKIYYANCVSEGAGKASDCIGCRGCERVCPQHIPISEWMPKVAADLEA